EDEQGEVLRNQGWSSMQGSLRIQGGMAALIDSLVALLPTKNLQFNRPIARLVRTGKSIEAFDAQGELVASARKVVLALPPRIASKLTFEPTLPEAAIPNMKSISTWMAGHAKFVAVYETPFWRDEGLSGDAMSRHGPMIEMHDASDPGAGLGAIFGFLGVPAHFRAGQHQAVVDACLAQLTRIFGSRAQNPLAAKLQDWAFEDETAIEADYVPPAGHPHYGLPSALSGLWDGQLMFGSTETANQFGGFLEGALEAAEYTAEQIIAVRSPTAG
ncbi:MAG: FAD-dependent oxidoreductase, partial [Pseudomonadota bacterium]